jgi:hypothetical protein
MRAGNAMAVLKSFEGTGIREYARTVLRLLDMAAELESGCRRAEGLIDGQWIDVSLAQADELRRSADCLAEVLNKLLSYSAA